MNIDDILKHSNTINNTGFDNTTGNSSGRVLNKDGSSNVLKSGIGYFNRISLFHTLINLNIFSIYMASSLQSTQKIHIN